MTTAPLATTSPRTQRSVVQSGYGAARDVLSLATDRPVEPPAPTQIQIEVHAASVNPIDWQMIEGNRTMIARRRFPFVPLFDLAGIVTAIGRAVTRFRVGDAVHADNKIHGGGAAEFVNVDEGLVSLKPASLSFVEAAALPLAGQTALLALDRSAVGPGSRVCVVGASGGVGSLAVQIARALGAHVVGVCSGRNAAFVRSLGADETVDYRATGLTDAVPARSFDAVVDCVGGRAQWIAAKTVLKDGGRFVTIARDEDGKLTVAAAIRLLAAVLPRLLASRFGRRLHYLPVFLDATHELLDRVDARVIASDLKVPIAAVHDFGLESVVAALEASKAGRTVGKVVIRLKP